jgi:hypothetical protein
VLPIFVIMSVVLLGGAALLTDVAWWWTKEQQMQRAADAAALAGAVYLPGNETRAFNAARAEAVKNGYTHGSAGVTVVPRRHATNPRKLIVDIDGSVSTNFARVFCWQGGPCLQSVAIGVTSAAEFVFPVPMGSPQNYFGVGLLRDEKTVTTTVPGVDDDTDWNPPNAFINGQWDDEDEAEDNDGDETTADGNGERSVWTNFGLEAEIEDSNTVIQGIQVQLDDVEVNGSSNSSSCTVTVEISWNAGDDWSTAVQTATFGNSATDRSVGSASSTSAWGAHSWVLDDFDDDNFQVRLTWNDNVSGCPNNRSVALDQLEVRVDYEFDDVTTTTSIEDVDVLAPDDVTVLEPQLFWGSLQSQGSPNVQGDAYMTYYDRRTDRTNTAYSAESFYHYGIEFPPGSSNGEVWVYDPGFCNVDSDKGTGEFYTLGGSNGSSSFNPVSTYYDLWNTHNTPFDYNDDIATGTVGSFGTDYRRLRLRDTDLDTDNPIAGATPCDDLAWHHGWVQIGSGLSGGNTYRLHTYSTDPTSDSDQRNSTTANNFAIWSTADGGTPRVYGLGAMVAYVRLPSGRATEFYLAQIDEEHAGKTMAISLWDPGDTGSLNASLEILGPFDDDYRPVQFRYTAEPNSSAATSDCDDRADDDAMAVITNSGGNSRFNGCWLNIEIDLDPEYDAPNPTSDTVTDEGGWWKIRYTMGGSTGSYSTDLTTWQVELRGNPVHLVPE